MRFKFSVNNLIFINSKKYLSHAFFYRRFNLAQVFSEFFRIEKNPSTVRITMLLHYVFEERVPCLQTSVEMFPASMLLSIALLPSINLANARLANLANFYVQPKTHRSNYL